MHTFKSYQVRDVLCVDALSIMAHAIREDGTMVLLKFPSEEWTNLDMVSRYEHEYEISKTIAIDGIMKVLDFENHEGLPVLVFEDCGAEISLGALKGNKRLTMGQYIVIGIRLIDLLDTVHRHSIIHLGITPNHVLYNTDNDELFLTGFGDAAFIKPQPAISHLSIHKADALEYMSPEQTGRMNRSVDYRSDFYSLGATLYELLTGRPPFTAPNLIELMHALIAQEPVPVQELFPEIIPLLNDVIMKMLKKNPEERYQSASGIRHDMEQCLALLHDEKLDYVIGQADQPERFCISEKLYGRTAELAQLHEVFSRCCQGEKELLTIAGYSGIGKSVLVREMGKPITNVRGFFVTGKFEQYRRNVPYSALVIALDQLLRQILSESPEQVDTWRLRLIGALGDAGSVITEVVPSMIHLIGPQPSVPSLPPIESQNRFNRLFKQLFHTLCHGKKPLVIFLDDIQWADMATLNLMEMLLSDEETGQLLMIGAYRNNEIGPSHPLLEFFDRIAQKELKHTVLVLKPLTSKHIGEMIADTLSQEVASVQGLSILISKKTQGNPFFIKQFLTRLYDDGALRFEHGIWAWDLDHIREMNITDNVVELLETRLKSLPETTQQSMRLAACIGNTFDLETLSIICQSTRESTRANLNAALKEGLILEIEHAWRLDRSERTFKFLHDRVQQAAHELIEVDKRNLVHLEIGRLLLAKLSEADQEDRLFELVDHLNQGLAFVGNQSDRQKIAVLNMRAAARAKDASAYKAALIYANIAADILGSYLWHDPRQGVAIRREQAELYYLNGDFTKSQILVEDIWQHAESDHDRADIQVLLITQWTMLGENEKAIDASKKAVSLFGMTYPNENELPSALDVELGEVRKNLRGRSVHMLQDNPPMTDPNKQSLMKILMAVHTPIFFAGMYNLYTWVLARMTNMSMLFGHVAESSKGYASFGNAFANNYGEYQIGFDFAMLGIELARRDNHKSLLCKNCLIMVMFLNHWIKPFDDAEHFDKEGTEAGFESGELQFIGYIMCYNRTLNRLHRGVPLTELSSKLKDYEQFCEKVKHYLSRDTIRGVRRLIDIITSEDGAIHPENESEAKYLDRCRANKSFAALATYFTIKAHVLYLRGQYSDAYESLKRAASDLIRIRGTSTTIEYALMESLVFAALFPTIKDHQARLEMVEKINANQKWLESLSKQCPDNFLHKYLLVEAELCRLRALPTYPWEVDDTTDVSLDKNTWLDRVGRLYDDAARFAEQNGFLQYHALAVHRAAEFYLSQQRQTIASVYLHEAVRHYKRWGAHNVVNVLEKHPLLAEMEIAPFDLQTVMQASRAVASDIVLDSLLDRMVRLSIENSGAERGVLLLYQDTRGEQITVEGILTRDALNVVPLDVSRFKETVPDTIINYVANTHYIVMLNDACSAGDFCDDPVVQARTLRSILCLPLVNKGRIVGVLYLENNLTGGVFTKQKVQVVELLASQAAIAIDNAHLYSTLEQNVVKLQTSNEKLLEQIAERQKVEKQLMQTQKIEAIGRLAGGVAHDLNNLLTPIISYSELILDDGELTEGTIKKIDVIFQAGMKAKELVHQLLAFARKQTLKYTPLDINTVVSEFEKFVRRTIRENIEIKIVLAPTVPLVMADVGQLEQVIMNLAVNAADAMPEEGTLIIATSEETIEENESTSTIDINPGVYVCLSVSDTGCGMDEETIQQIFDPFYSTKGEHGTGLGLATVFGIIKQHHGGIRVESVPGKGTTFNIYLPAYYETQNTVQQSVSTMSNPTTNGALTILLMEDNTDVRNIAYEILKKHGYHVLVAMDGMEALAILEKQGDTVQLLVTDVIMPVMNGKELYEKASIKYPGLRVLYMSGYTNDVIASHGVLEEGVHLLEKPFTPKSLIKKIQEVMEL